MKIVEKSRERLALRLTRYGLRTGVCVLDGARDTTTVVRMALVIPYYRKSVPLSQIRDVTVRREGERGGYRAALKTVTGRDILIGEFTKEDALEAAKAIRDFLRSNRETDASPDQSRNTAHRSLELVASRAKDAEI